jgi:hypothetical protein
MSTADDSARAANGFDRSLPADREQLSLGELAAASVLLTGLTLQVSILVWNALTTALYLGSGGPTISWWWSVFGVTLFVAGGALLRRIADRDATSATPSESAG